MINTFYDLLDSLFCESGYRKLVGSLYVNNNPKSKDFWLLVNDFDLDSQYVVLEDLLSKYMELQAEEKNISILVVKCVSGSHDNNQDEIMRLENDAYCFKKYALYYTDEAWQALLSVLTHSEGTKIGDLMLQESVFENLKEENNNAQYGPYSLLYSIAHKLPFLLMNVAPQQLVDSHYKPSEDDQKLFCEINNLFALDGDERKQHTNEYINQLINEDNEDTSSDLIQL